MKKLSECIENPLAVLIMGWVKCAVLERRDDITNDDTNELLPYSISKFDANTLSSELHNVFIEALNTPYHQH
ncbi:8119_t:CDS:2 [Diversispora eburnea]|uniref:8119_t:CDS:1 n=1 Tax=Diversispora eburnea TaxID=1213867 RepID=A0A9N8ZAW7_9GLOM|nr:8119_t:CDS:2 [Diversispora eburnea]